MYTYIRKNIKGFYATFPKEIDAEYWAGKIGTTFDDFYDNKWVLLSDEQAAFHIQHPEASLREVWDMEIVPQPQPDPVDVAKRNKIAEIEQYDSSSAINDFTVNTDTHVWFTPQERSNYRNSIDAAKLMNVNQLQVFAGDTLITLTTEQAEQMLAAIQLYADQCYIVTRQHKANVEALETVEAVQAYDNTTGYPTKLNFNIQ